MPRIYEQKSYSVNLYRMKCPICNKRGRLSINYVKYTNTQHINLGKCSVQHWKTENKKKIYSHMCRLSPELSNPIKEKDKDLIQNKIEIHEKRILSNIS